MGQERPDVLSKVFEVTLIFWIIKILVNKPGGTGGDSVSMSMHLGCLISTGFFAVILLVALAAQISAN